jgi:retinol dehydrogenase 12
LDDLTTIKASAEEFLAKETRLDVLWNNAGVMLPPQGSKTKQNYELQLGTNVVAPFLFTKLLTPILTKTAQSSPAGSVRVVWVSSSAARRFAPQGGVDLSNLDYKKDESAWHKYGVSKAGNILHAKEFAKQYKNQGIVSVVSL